MVAFNSNFTPEQEIIALWFYKEAYDKAYDNGHADGMHDAQTNMRLALGLETPPKAE